MRFRSLLRGIWRRNFDRKAPKWAKINHPPVAEARTTVLESLDPLFARAKAEKLWFWNRSLNLWLSPSELRAKHGNLQYIWGPDHWTLRNPMEFKR